jgi:hypothetical protein
MKFGPFLVFNVTLSQLLFAAVLFVILWLFQQVKNKIGKE